jgi:hypothetical protein
LASFFERRLTIWLAIQGVTIIAFEFLLFLEHTDKRKCLSLVPHGLLRCIRPWFRLYGPLLIGIAVTAVHVDIVIVVVVIQTLIVVFGLQVLPIEEPFLIVTTMTIVHVDILIIVIVVQAFTVPISLQLLPVEVPLLVSTIMAIVHVDVLIVVIVVQALVIILGLEMSMLRLTHRCIDRARNRHATGMGNWIRYCR